MTSNPASADVLIIAGDQTETQRADVQRSIEESMVPLGRVDVHRGTRDNVNAAGGRTIDVLPVPTLAELQAYDAILVYGIAPWSSSSAYGDVIGDYVRAGGGVVTAWNNTDTPLSGRWAGLDPLRANDTEDGTEHMLGGTIYTGHPVLAGVNSFSGGTRSFRASNPTLRRNEDLVIANWGDGTIFAAESGRYQGKLVNLNFIPVSDRAITGSWRPSPPTPGYGQLMLGQALAYVASPAAPIQRVSEWRYLDDGSDQGELWRLAEFDDSSWSTGSAPFGYGDPNMSTEISFGPNSNSKFITTYFRKEFQIDDPETVESLTANLRRDDGAIIYLNGVEVARSNMGDPFFDTDIDFETRADGTAGGDDELAYHLFPVALDELREGTNVIAVEVHQASSTSSDMVFDLSLGRFDKPPTQPRAFDPGELVVTGLPEDVFSVGTADFDRDGEGDIVFAVADRGQIGWVAGDGEGNFGEAQFIDTSAGKPRFVLAHDADGDGDPDVFAARERSSVVWYRNEGDGTFSSAIDLGGVAAWRLKVLDFNGDNIPDVVSQDVSFAPMNVFVADGAGAFTREELVFARGRDFELVDLDGDGLLDMTRVFDSSLGVFWGLPGGGFSETALSFNNQIGNISGGRNVRVADFDQDGTLDILLGQRGNRRLYWFRGLGGRNFQVTPGIEIGQNFIALEIGDFDGDTDIDIAYVTSRFGSRPSVASWLANDGDGGFAELPRLIDDMLPASTPLHAGDVDLDGDLDLITGGTNSASWMRNITEHATLPEIGSFDAEYAIIHRSEGGLLRWSVTGNPTVTIEPGIGEVDGDSLVVSPSETTTYTITATTPNGSVTAQTTIEVVDRPVIHRFETNLDNVDRTTEVLLSWFVAGADSVSISPVIGAVSSISTSVVVYETTEFTLTATNSNGSDTAPLTVTTLPSIFRYGGDIPQPSGLDGSNRLAVADFNRDGYPDFVSSSQMDGGTTGGQLFWFRSDTSGGFQAGRQIAASSSREFTDVVVGDFNADGWPDVASVKVRSSSSPPQVVVYRNNGGNSWSETAIQNPSPFHTMLGVGDLDGDGIDDLVAANDDPSNAQWFRSLGNGQFSPAMDLVGSADGLTEFLIIDIDGDADNDILSSYEEGSGSISWHENRGGGDFAPRRTLLNVGRVYDFDVGDIDGDGRLDIAVGLPNPNLFRAYFGNGTGGFEDPRYLGEGSASILMDVVLADFDGDGDLDAALHGRKLSWAENLGDRNFVLREPTVQRDDINDFAPIDIDLDGDLDLALARRTDNRPFAWVENLGRPPSSPPEILHFESDRLIMLPGTRLNLRWAIAGSPTAVEIAPSPGSMALAVTDRLATVVAVPTDTETTQSYTLTATNPAGTTTSTLTFRVGNPPVISDFLPVLPLVNEGESADLSWITERADEHEIDGLGSVAASGGTVQPLAPTTGYTLIATNVFGETRASTSIEVNRSPVGTPTSELVADAQARPASALISTQFSDPDDGDVLSYEIVGDPVAPFLTALEIDPATGQLDTAFADFTDGRVDVTVRATDRNGLTAETIVPIVLPRIADPGIEFVGTPQLNRQTGLYEQRLIIQNTAGRDIGSFRIDIPPSAGTGLYNRSGQTGNLAEVIYTLPLEAGGSRELVLEYYSPTRSTIWPDTATTTQLLPLDATVAPAGSTSAPDRIVALEGGALLIEWPALPGTRYGVLYSDDLVNWKASPIAIRAAGTRLQWIDQGLPSTLTHPSTSPSRSYRIVTLPGEEEEVSTPRR